MKIVISIDSFKGSLSSMEAGNAVAAGIHRVAPQTEVVIKPLADGGEGTVSALIEGMNGQKVTIPVTGPLEEKVQATYGVIADQKLAVIEMSEAAGLTLVPPAQRNPLFTTTYGVGELILDAVEKGCRHFIIGIGGSATNDGGAGMLQALGFDLLDANEKPIALGGQGLAELKEIRCDRVPKVLQECEFRIACDVTNPLCGPNGSSAVFGPQKGATKDMVADLDGWLMNFAKVAQAQFPKADPLAPGTGAAGGLGFAFQAFLQGKLEPGIDIVLETIALEAALLDADLVITGEGRLDEQTAMGKAPVGVAKLAKKHKKTVIAFAGSVTSGARECNKQGIDAYFPILRQITTLEEAMDQDQAAQNLADTTEQVIRLVFKEEN
ncbi:glycerate kinase [Enterococcus asini]|uniref:Glycerate kinase n=1 Tax=Enterococcus asini TaxID=57732 RepID=A0AAW8U027_9ENTE|nr:glycerate kinase [Enterococcus asini]MDT2811036.1 glycerate kinase [Enterococcus asini]